MILFQCVGTPNLYYVINGHGQPLIVSKESCKSFYRTRVRSLGMRVTNSLTQWVSNSLTHSLTDSCLVNLMWPWRVKIFTPNSRLLQLLVLVMRIVLATVCCRFGSWGLVKKLNICSDFEHNFSQDFEIEVKARFEAGVWSVFCCWCFVEVMKLNLVGDSEARFGKDFEF